MLKDEDRLKDENHSEEELDTVEEIMVENEVLEGSEEIMSSNLEEEDEEKEEIRRNGFMAKLGANIIDQAMNLAVSFIFLYLFNMILTIFGYRVSNKALVFIVMYVIINLIYAIIFEATKLKKTLGKSILKLQ